MIEVSSGRWALEWAAYLVISALGSVATYVSMSGTPPASALCVAVFYGPAWFVINAFFGGLHGAPRWSIFPSVIIAVLVQNGMIWWLIRATDNLVRRRTESKAAGRRG